MKIFDDSSVNVSVKTKIGSNEVKVVFLKDGVEIPATSDNPTVTVTKPTVGSDEVRAKFKPPAVDATKETYKLTYQVVIGSKPPLKTGEEWDVWRHEVDLTCKIDEEGLKEKGPLKIYVQQNGTRSKPTTVNSTGKQKITIPAPGEFEIHTVAPHEFVRYLDGKDKGPERVIEYKSIPAKAVIVAPFDVTQKRFVNIPRIGNEVQIDLKTVSIADSNVAVARHLVNVEVKFTNKTKRGKGTPTTPSADYTKEGTVTGLTVTTRGDRKTEESVWVGTVTTNEAGKATFTVHLGKGGGEECEVKVGATKTVEDDKRSFTTWRQILLQFCHSDTDGTRWLGQDTAAFRKTLKECYDEVFIDFDVRVAKYKDDYNALARGGRTGWKDKSTIGKSGEGKEFVVFTDGSSWKSIAEIMKPLWTEAGLYVNVAATDIMTGRKDLTADLPPKKHTDLTNGAFSLTGAQFSADEGKFTYFKNSAFKTNVHYRVQRVDLNTAPFLFDIAEKWASGKIPEESVSITPWYVPRSGDRGTLEFTLPAAAVQKLKDNPNMHVIFTIDAVMATNVVDMTLGINTGYSVILGDGTKDNAEGGNTIIHEIGHALGMVGDGDDLKTRLPDYASAPHPHGGRGNYFPEHGRWYDERGHQGPHCAEGESDSGYSNWNTLIAGAVSSKYTCVLFGSSQFFKTPSKWCSRCKDMLMAMEVRVGK